MTKFNFTNEQIERAQEVAKLMVTLNHIGNGFLGESVEDVEKFINAVNGIEEEKEEKVEPYKNEYEQSIEALESKLKNLINQRDILNATFGDNVESVIGYSPVIRSIGSLKYIIHLLKESQ